MGVDYTVYTFYSSAMHIHLSVCCPVVLIGDLKGRTRIYTDQLQVGDVTNFLSTLL